jgi:hypothetical protein
MWEAWRFVTDGGDYDEGIVARLVGLVLVLSGMLFFALLIGLIGESIQTKLEGLKHGRNRVVDSGALREDALSRQDGERIGRGGEERDDQR